VRFDAGGLASGMYLYTLEQAGRRLTRKMSYIR